MHLNLLFRKSRPEREKLFQTEIKKTRTLQSICLSSKMRIKNLKSLKTKIFAIFFIKPSKKSKILIQIATHGNIKKIIKNSQTIPRKIKRRSKRFLRIRLVFENWQTKQTKKSKNYQELTSLCTNKQTTS